ncbi:hypothetical protein [uncultured Vagococcus sp.]|uniref:hypothetical protein n=1 Tax=uncultured Vagococcus sp. TaxID=189676 RepID=UPI0028D6D1B5|nr:hypothetical protein [uncultured Vagococcus sp.]
MKIKHKCYCLLLFAICFASFQLGTVTGLAEKQKETTEQKVTDYDSKIGIGFSEKRHFLELPKTGDPINPTTKGSRLPQTNDVINTCLTYLGVTLVGISMMIYKFSNGRKENNEKQSK